MKDFIIRKAVLDDCDKLTEISFAAKRHWKYPEQYFEVWKSELTINSEYISKNIVYVADMDGKLAGYFSIAKVDKDFWSGKVFVNSGNWLEHIFIQPEFIGIGIGSNLIAYAKQICLEKNIDKLFIFSDPNANGFYYKIGAKYIKESQSSIEGRTVSLFELAIRGLSENIYFNALEDSLFSCYSEFGKAIKNGFSKLEHFEYADCRPSIWPTNVYHIKFDNENYRSVFENIIDAIKQGKLPADIVLKGISLNHEIRQYLSENFDLIFDSPGMCVELETINMNTTENIDFKVEIVKSKEDLLAFATAVSNILFENEKTERIVAFASIIDTLIQKEKICCFNGKIGDRVVATSLLYINEEIGGIYHVCVEPQMRGKGFGRKVTTSALLHARNMNLKHGFLVASDMGRPVYEKIGFKEFTRYSKYRLKKEFFVN